MKRLITLLLSVVLFSGCASSPTLNTFGPLAAQVAQTRIAYAILERNPNQVHTLEAIADALQVVADGTSGTEISESLIRGWVSSNAPKWGLLPGEDELLVQGLLAARQALLNQTKLASIKVGDSELRPWLDAVRNGIRAGVAAHKRGIPTPVQPAPSNV